MHYLLNTPTGSVIFIALLAFVLFTVYFVPSLLGWAQQHKHLAWVVTANILLGWTILGWLICLIWAIWPTQVRDTQ